MHNIHIMKPKSILQNLFALLVVLCNVLEINAQTSLRDKILAEANTYKARFEHWRPTINGFSMRPMYKCYIADIEQYSEADLGPFYYDAKLLHSIDTTYSAPDAIYFKVLEKDAQIATTFPMFQLDGDSVNIDVKIGYKNLCGCQDMLLTFNVIDENMATAKTDTIHLSLSSTWTAPTVSLSLPRGILLQMMLTITPQSNVQNLLSLGLIEVSANGKPLTWAVDKEKYGQVPASAIQPFDDLLASPLMDKKILALGETMHGSLSIGEQAQDIIKERIMHHNCRLVTLEFPTEAVLYMNRYVKNDARFSLDSIPKFYEAKALFKITPFLKWLHDYNAVHNNEVTLIGADTFLSKYETLQSLFDFLKPLNADYRLDSLCYDLMFSQNNIKYDYLAVNELLTPDEVFLFRLSLEPYAKGELTFPFASRDSLMAHRIQKFCDLYLPKNQTATFYTHLFHANYISFEPFLNNRSASIGNYLKQRYKDDYACLAISAAQGERAVTDNLQGIATKNTLLPALDGSFEHITNSGTDDKPIFISTSNLKQGDIYQIRMLSAIDVRDDFCTIEPHAFMDGVVILKDSKPLDTDRKTFQQIQQETVSRFFSNMLEMRERVKGKMQ